MRTCPALKFSRERPVFLVIFLLGPLHYRFCSFFIEASSNFKSSQITCIHNFVNFIKQRYLDLSIKEKLFPERQKKNSFLTEIYSKGNDLLFFVLVTFLFCQHCSQLLWSGSIFITANEKLVCCSLQGQGTRALWWVVKIDWEHKLSAPLKDLEAPMCRWACAFEPSPSVSSV